MEDFYLFIQELSAYTRAVTHKTPRILWEWIHLNLKLLYFEIKIITRKGSSQVWRSSGSTLIHRPTPSGSLWRSRHLFCQGSPRREFTCPLHSAPLHFNNMIFLCNTKKNVMCNSLLIDNKPKTLKETHRNCWWNIKDYIFLNNIGFLQGIVYTL